MEIIVDTREQRPLFIGDRYTRYGLIVGDYTTRELWHTYASERKSLQDLCGTITGGNGRFHRELIRAKANGIKLVMVVEGTRKNFIAKKFPRGHERKISGEVLNKIITTFETKHGLEVHWCCSRAQACRKIRALFKIEEALVSTTRNGVKQKKYGS
jgi:ERCC4-type nuclease